MVNEVLNKSNGVVLPGWEPERLAHVMELFEAYKDVNEEKLRENFKYFMSAIIDTCQERDVKWQFILMIHPTQFLVYQES